MNINIPNLFNQTEQQTMGSREIAELTSKRHDHVLRDCDMMNENYVKMGLPKIGEGFYTHPINKQEYREFRLSKIQTLDLMTGYNLELRIKVNRRWEELENNVNIIQNPIAQISRKEIALMLVQAEEEKEKLEQQNQILSGENNQLINQAKSLAPMASYANEVLQSTSTYTFTQVSFDLGMRSVHVLTKFLKQKDIIYRKSGQWLPKANYAGKGYFSTRTAKYVKHDDTVGSSITTVITEKGRQWLHSLINEE